MNIRKVILAIIVVAGLGFGLSSCVTEIKRGDLPPFVQKIVVNMVASNLDKAQMEVSLTASPYDSTDNPRIVTDAIVQFKVNGNDKTFVYNPGTEKYESNVSFNPEDQLQVSVSLQNKSIVSSAVSMPRKLYNLSSNLVVNGGKDATGNDADLIQLSFDDDPGATNYYLVHFYYYSEIADIFLPFEFTSSDVVLNSPQTIKTNEGGYLFGDESFNGTKRTFSIVAQAGLTETNSDIKYLIEVHSLGRDYYAYLKTLEDFRDAQDNTGGATTLGSAVVVHSNISGGLGIFGAKTVESDTLR